MTEHQQYPMTMAHPAYQASVPLPVPGTERLDAYGRVISQDYQGTPERFAPVTVADAEQQAYYESQGYEPAGKSDPSAYAMAHASPAPPNYVPAEYPKWVGDVLVNNAEDEAELKSLSPTKDEILAAGELVKTINDQVADNSTIGSLRKAYEAQFGKRPFNGWNAEQLREKLAA